MRRSSGASRWSGSQATIDPMTPASIRRRGPAGMASDPSRRETMPSDATVSAHNESACRCTSTAAWGWSNAVEQFGRRAQPRRAPEVVPVEVVEGTEMLGGHAGGQQASQLGAAAPLRAPFVLDPLRALRDGSEHRLDRLSISGEAPVLGDRPQRATVGVPLSRLAEEEPVSSLPAGIRTNHLGDLRREAVLSERGEQERSVPEPESVVGARTGRDVRAVVQCEQEPAVRVHRFLQPRVGQYEAHASTTLRGPTARHLLGRGDRDRKRRRALDATACPCPAACAAGGYQRQRDAQGRGVGQRIDERGLRHPRFVAKAGRDRARAREAREDDLRAVAVVERRGRDLRGWSRQQHRDASVHGHRRSVVQADALDDREPFGVVRTNRERHREWHGAAVLDLDDDHLGRVVAGRTRVARVRAMHRVATRHAHRRLHDRRGRDETLPYSRRWFAGRYVPAVLSADPPVERPAVEPCGDETTRIDDRLPRRCDVADERPVACRHVGEERQVTPRCERGCGRVELSLEPVRPHPVGTDLRRGARSQRAEHGAGADRQELAWRLDLDRLAESLERREMPDDVVVDAQSPHGAPQRPRAEPAQCSRSGCARTSASPGGSRAAPACGR